MIWNFENNLKNSKSAVDDAFSVSYLVWNIPKAILISKTRDATIVRMRWIMYAALREREMTYQFIGDQFDRGHDTVIYGLSAHDEEMELDDYSENFNKFMFEFKKRLRGGDSHPNGTEGRTPCPNAILGRKELTNIGGFSDYI